MSEYAKLPWRKKVTGNIGHAIEALVVATNDTHGYHDEGWRIVCSYQGHYKNAAGLNEEAHAEAIGDHILRCVNAHDRLVAALREIDELLPEPSLPIAHAIKDIVRAALSPQHKES